MFVNYGIFFASIAELYNPAACWENPDPEPTEKEKQ